MATRAELTLIEARDLILSSPAPVLMCDTCGLLDVVRSPFRPKSGGLQPVIALLQVAEKYPKQVHIVVPALVVEEWERHYERISKELRDHIDATRTHVQALRSACDACGFPLPEELSDTVERLKEALPDVAARLFASAVVIAPDESCRTRAGTRAAILEPPAQRGGLPDDCVVVEHCLGLAFELASASFNLPRVFVTSNTNDYCLRGTLHPRLSRYFNPVSLEFATNLAAASRKLWPAAAIVAPLT